MATTAATSEPERLERLAALDRRNVFCDIGVPPLVLLEL